MKHYHIPIFVPHRGCPFDCVFCNQRRISGTEDDPTPQTADQTIREYLQSLPESDCHIEVAFFGGSFTGIPMEEQTAFLKAAYRYQQAGKIHGIRLSTRPDYITSEILENLRRFGVTVIELGVQSMCVDVLLVAGRGHTPEDVEKAVSLIREYPFSLGLQVMTGLPGADPEKDLETARRVAALHPDFVRIYPTLVIEDTELAELYRTRRYCPMDVPSSVKLCKDMKVHFLEAGIDVIRVSLQTTDEICEKGSVLAGPYHPAFGELVDSMIFWDRITEALKGRRNCRVSIFVNRRDISRAVGHKRSNLEGLRREYGIQARVLPDPNILPLRQNGAPRISID